jgi:hypothetical protein
MGDEWEMTSRKLQCEPRALRRYRQLRAWKKEMAQKSTESAESRKEHSTDSTEEGEKAKIPPLPGLVQHLASRHKHKQPGQLGLFGRQQRLSIGNRCRAQFAAHPPIVIIIANM